MTEAFTEARLSPLRKAIAARMSEAKRTIPHFRVVANVEVDALLEARAAARARSPRKATVNDLIVKACATALEAHPELNVQFEGDTVRRFRDAHVAVVVALEGGLSTPVVRAANTKSVWEIASEVRNLAERAAAGRLRMEEITGGTFSVSNLGSFGAESFDAIINPPQAAIMAIGRASSRPVVRPGGGLAAAKVMTVQLSVDHRVIDGAQAATFLETFRRLMAEPDTLFEEGARV